VNLVDIATKPRVTILVPVYNGASYLAETLNSLLVQTYRDFELLIIEDGSTDTSASIVKSFSDPRIRMIQTKNGGLCSALNRGTEEARGEYIARNDQDDLSLPYRLEREMVVADSYPEALGMFSYNSKIGEKHRWSNSDKLTMSKQVKTYDPIKDGCLLGSTMLARTSALRELGGFRQAYYPADDWDLEFRLSEQGKVLVICEPLVTYRFHQDASTYRTFAEMQQKKYWTEDSHNRRVHSLPELTFEEFLAQMPQGLRSRIHRHRIGSSKLFTRRAGQHLLDGHYLKAVASLTAASFLNPIDIFRRIERMTNRNDKSPAEY
jgi:glycosyltransferase involved in cell wall biosynthesis